MSLLDESRAAFRELKAVMTPTATIKFNGITKEGISHSITVKRMQQLQGYGVEASSEFEMENEDFALFVRMGLKDRVSKVVVNGTDELVYVQKDTHPNSATVHLFLVAVK